MTAHDSYVRGFRKKAVSQGYNPDSLALYALRSKGLTKSAAWNSFLGKGIGRYFELLFGGVGRGPALKRISLYQKHIDKLKQSYEKAKLAYKGQIRGLDDAIKQREALLKSRHGTPADMAEITNLRTQLYELKRRGMTDQMVTLKNKIRAKKNMINRYYTPIANESNKVLATRWGTGLAGMGGIGWYMNSHNKEKNDFGTDDYYMDS